MAKAEAAGAADTIGPEEMVGKIAVGMELRGVVEAMTVGTEGAEATSRHVRCRRSNDSKHSGVGGSRHHRRNANGRGGMYGGSMHNSSDRSGKGACDSSDGWMGL